MPRRISPASDTGFSLHHFPALMLLPTAGFSVRGVFLQSASGKNIVGVGRGTLASAGFFYSFVLKAGVRLVTCLYWHLLQDFGRVLQEEKQKLIVENGGMQS